MAVHVLVTVYDPAHAPLVVASANVKLIELPQASDAVAIVKTGVAGQFMVDGAGREEMTGGVIS